MELEYIDGIPYIEDELEYDQIFSHLDTDGVLKAYVEIEYTLKVALELAAEQEWQGYAGVGEELYEELAEKVIGNQWCYNGIYWEDANNIEPRYGGTVVLVTIEPDLED